MKEEELLEKEVDVKDTRRTVDAIRAYDRAKDASPNALSSLNFIVLNSSSIDIYRSPSLRFSEL